MTERYLLPVVLWLLVGLAGPAAADAAPLRIGYVELADDARYADDAALAGIEFRTLGRPLPGAELGIEDAATVGRVIGVEFELVTARDDVADLVEEVRNWASGGVAFVVADLPAPALLALADAVADLPVTVLNVSARDDTLRGEECRANVLHVVPSDAMLTDALVQYLIYKGWSRILLMQGEAEADRALASALQRSARKFGARVVDTVGFALTSDPRRREQANVALMTAGAPAHDVVFVADASGEFDRYVGYQTSAPRLVVGTAGLSPRGWHWTWNRYGAPQLQHRFEALTPPRRMNEAAWAAYAAVKAITQSALRSDPADPEAMRAHLTSDDLRLDASKGVQMSFRPWSGQLRQPILLATADATIATAPLEQFIHRINDLDTLGVDEPESDCPGR